MKTFAIFVNSVLAGCMIGVGGTVFLSCDNKVAGALFFSLGLLTIVTRGFYLFTGKAGYAVEQPPAYMGFLAQVWLGNFVGTGLVGLAVRATRVGGAIAEKSAALWQTKSADSLLSIFILAVFCGLLMYLAVDGYKNASNEVAKVLMVLFCVIVFILSGFEHCIANMFYGWAALCWTPDALLRLVVMTVGNLAGGVLVPLSKKVTVPHCN